MAAGRYIALVAALSLAAAPAAAVPEPAPEAVEGSELREETAYYVLPLLVVIALLIAILAGEDGPATP